MKSKILILTIIILIIFTSPAYAHKPLFERWDSNFNNPVIVPQHEISYAVYGELKTKQDVDFVKFSAKTGDTFYVQLTIPVIKGNEEFKPYVALIGQGIIEKGTVPFNIPENYGIIVLPPGPKDYFYEKFTQTEYYLGQSIRGEIPEDGDYFIAVYSTDKGGKYSLAVGEKEKFGILDILAFPYMYARVKYFFNPFATVLTVIVIFTALALIIKFIKKRR